MHSTEKTPTHQESLAIITEAINKTKDNYRNNSFYFLLWGWLIALASIGFFVLHQYTAFEYYFIPFPILATVGIITTIVYYLRQHSKAPTESYMTYFLSRLWLVLGASFILVVFINVSQHHAPFTYTLIIAGIGTAVSGIVMRFKPMTWGGIFFFASAVASIYIPDAFSVLLQGVAIIVGYLIPGYLLKNSNK